MGNNVFTQGGDYHEDRFYRLWKYGNSHVKGNSEKWRSGSDRYDRLDVYKRQAFRLSDFPSRSTGKNSFMLIPAAASREFAEQ